MARLFLISLTLVAALVTACGKNDAPELPGNPQSPGITTGEGDNNDQNEVYIYLYTLF